MIVMRVGLRLGRRDRRALVKLIPAVDRIVLDGGLLMMVVMIDWRGGRHLVRGEVGLGRRQGQLTMLLARRCRGDRLRGGGGERRQVALLMRRRTDGGLMMMMRGDVSGR